jgi:tetratricopeptide (TPR) repeat protein
MLSRVANDLKCPLSSADRGVLAYAYSLSGKDDEALKWAEKALSTAQSPSEKAQADFRLYQIRSRMGDDSHALRSLEAVMEYSNSVEMASLMKSVASSRKDFLDQQHMATQHRLRSTRLTAAFILLSLMSVVFAMLGYIRYKRLEAAKILAEEKAETEKYMNIAEDLQAKLKTASKRLPSEKHMSIAKFDVLERLCEQYYVYEGTPNLQDKVLKEVKSVIQGLRDDPKMLKGLELMLDRNCNEIVRRLREQLPKLKEDDIRLFVFAASGFSSTTISTILEKDKGIVYNRIWRLKGKISSSEASDKDDFLDSLNA